MNQQIGAVSLKLENRRQNHNQCNSNFHGIEKTFSDYRSWSEQRKALIRDRIKTIEMKFHQINHIMNDQNPMNQKYGQVMSIRSSIKQDCILPD